jgi:iron complex outermembrane recepter protein
MNWTWLFSMANDWFVASERLEAAAGKRGDEVMKANIRASFYVLASTSGLVAIAPQLASAQTVEAEPEATSTQSSSQLDEIVVTAQKREERVQSVAMSIQAVSGDALTSRGVNSVGDLVKLVPGLVVSEASFGPPRIGLRGVVYLDLSLAASPTVSVYNDQVPLPFSIESLGSTLDLQRVEVLKGPQGTLFGSNATGGAINYIANRPTQGFEAGGDFQYGRFNTVDAQAYLSGPLSSTLGVRLAARTVQADGWQKNYINGSRLGARNFTTARLTLDWKPSSKLNVVGTLSGFYDRSESTAPQFFALSTLSPTALPVPGILSFPVSPKNARAAAWPSCINDSPLNTHCVDYKSKNHFIVASLRADYEVSDDITLTSLSSYQRFKQYQPQALDGTTFQDTQTLNTGHLKTFYQEVRLSGNFAGKGVWMLGGNYQHDTTDSGNFITLTDSSAAATFAVFGPNVIAVNTTTSGLRNTYAGFGRIEYPIATDLTLEAGVRYTVANQTFSGCQRDAGNGRLGAIYNLLLGTNIQPGGCTTINESLLPVLFNGKLNEDNISYRVGVNWKASPDVLLYANVSQGYKAGAFSAISATRDSEYAPAAQEKLVAYEAGIKSELFNNTLRVNAAAFYYNYSDKQIQGYANDPIFGALPKLVNIPKSRVVGFEISAIWKPFDGLSLMPVVSYASTRIGGNFTQYNDLAQLQNFNGEKFPGVPELQANIDAQYDWQLSDKIAAFVGANVTYQGQSNSLLGDFPIADVPDYTLVDLRAGIETGAFRFQVWGKNVFDKYYYTQAAHSLDVYTRYAGMPATYGLTLSFKYK